MPPGNKPFENTVGKGEIAISPFPTVFSSSLDNFLPFPSNLKLSSANSFSLEESKICRLVMGYPFTKQSKLKMTMETNVGNKLHLSINMNQYPHQLFDRNRQFNPFPNNPWFSQVCSTSLLKTLWEKEKLLVTSNFSFSCSVFYPSGELSAIFIIFEIVVCKLFQF